MATKKNNNTSSMNTNSRMNSQENGSIGGNMTKQAVARAKKTTDTEALKQEVAAELGITPDHIYVSYSEFANWGWNGSNF